MKPTLVTATFLAAIAATPQAPAKPSPLLQPSDRTVVFLGDSITHAGGYIHLLEAALRQAGHLHPDTEFINLGLPSETCSGLSEPGHPFPRPDVHTRLDAALAKTQPDLVFACYGMNDGIYHPPRTDRLEAYQNGVRNLAEKVNATGARLVLLTPPPFDPQPVAARKPLVPFGEDLYGYTGVYRHYDRDVLASYAAWLRAGGAHLADKTIDLHTTVNAALAGHRAGDPDFTFARDGIHPDARGHRTIAAVIHRALGYGELPQVDPALLDAVRQRHAILHPAWLTHVGHDRPGMQAGLPLPEARAQAAEIPLPTRHP